MKRRVLTILLFLLLGAAVNVAVAWGCAAWVSGGTEDDVAMAIRRPSGEAAVVIVLRVRSFGLEKKEISGVIPSEVLPDGADEYVWHRRSHSPPSCFDEVPFPILRQGWSGLGFMRWGDRDVVVESDQAAGWPMLGMWGALAAHSRSPKGDWEYIQYPVGSIPLDRHLPHYAFRDYRALPLRPIWPGFAVNGVFYAVTIWLLFFVGPRAVRRQIRRRRGRCLKCGYDLRGTPAPGTRGCPECGWNREEAKA